MSRAALTIPKINKPMMGGFRAFNRRYLRKHFHTIAVQRSALDECEIRPDDSFVAFANHPSWWDPLMAMYLADTMFPDFRMYAPIDADAFEKYRMFGQMGFFPLRQDSFEGASNFVRTSRAILSEPGNSVWMTPEGRFADVRDTGAELMPGMSHLAHSILKRKTRGAERKEASNGDSRQEPSTQARRVWFVVAAIEYVFWEEKNPEALIWFNRPILVDPADAEEVMGEEAFSKAAWQKRLTDSLREVQARLAEASIARDASQFEVLCSSSGSTFFLYDWWRRLKSKVTGKPIDLGHGEKFS